jgi:hypothetical protein
VVGEAAQQPVQTGECRAMLRRGDLRCLTRPLTEVLAVFFGDAEEFGADEIMAEVCKAVAQAFAPPQSPADPAPTDRAAAVDRRVPAPSESPSGSNTPLCASDQRRGPAGGALLP